MVDIPVIYVQEPVVALAVVLQPGFDQSVHVIGRFEPARELVAVEFGEPGGEPPGHVPLGKTGKRDGVVAGVLEVPHEHGPLGIVAVALARIAHVLARPVVADHPVENSETARE